MINMSALKKSSSKDLLAKLQSKVETSDTKKTFEKDTRMWQPATDSAGNGSAVIRFLPAVSEDDTPYVKSYSHGFKVGSKWFIENCPSTLGIKDGCPVCSANSELWNSGLESDKKIAGERKRKLSFYSNVLVIKDPANPENEGQVRIYRYGQKIFDKIKEAIKGDEDMEVGAIDPFNFFDGANFVIKIAQVAGFKNYDKSKFASKTELYDGDEDKLRAILEKLHDINSFADPKLFKSSDELQKKFDLVLGASTSKGSMSVADSSEEFEQVQKSKPATERAAPAKPAAVVEDEEDDMAFFKALANG
jgi:hypothetical protein